jgi:cation:H+ antiporter
VVAGAELFFDAVLGAAARLRVSAFALTVLVSGFELENLAAGIAANANDLPGAAAGTFLGGATFLALAVAGFGGLMQPKAAPLSARLPGRVLGWTALSPVPLALLALDERLSRIDGALLVIWFAAAIAGLAWAGRALGADAPAQPRKRAPLVRLVAGLSLLTVGGELLGEGARRTVARLGVSETLLGNTAIAASVEAEELARVAVAVRRGRADLALANVTGTIVHFTSFNAGVIALVQPLPLDADTLDLHLPAAVASTLVLCALLGLRGGISRRAGAILVGLYGAYVTAAIAVAAG